MEVIKPTSLESFLRWENGHNKEKIAFTVMRHGNITGRFFLNISGLHSASSRVVFFNAQAELKPCTDVHN